MKIARWVRNGEIKRLPAYPASKISRDHQSPGHIENGTNDQLHPTKGDKDHDDKDLDDTQDRNTGTVARSAARAAQGREGANAAQRRAGAAAAGAAVGSGRQGISLRDRRWQRLAGGPLPNALAAPRLPLHVPARLQRRAVRVVFRSRTASTA